MTTHIMGLYSCVGYLKNRTDNQLEKEWEKIESSVSRQFSLRVLSAIQIASKLINFHDSLSKKQVKRCLQMLGFSYTDDVVMKSELRVFKTINFNANYRSNPVYYIESLLKVLVVKKADCGLNAKALWDYSLICLDYVYLQLDEVYGYILNLAKLNSVSKDRMRRLQSDYLLLAAGVISCASVCVYGKSTSISIANELSKIASLPVEDVADMSTGIIEKVIYYQTISNVNPNK